MMLYAILILVAYYSISIYIFNASEDIGLNKRIVLLHLFDQRFYLSPLAALLRSAAACTAFS